MAARGNVVALAFATAATLTTLLVLTHRAEGRPEYFGCTWETGAVYVNTP